jgi:hypothetical protein
MTDDANRKSNFAMLATYLFMNQTDERATVMHENMDLHELSLVVED